MLARIRIGVGQSERALRLLDETLGNNERFGLHELDAELLDSAATPSSCAIRLRLEKRRLASQSR